MKKQVKKLPAIYVVWLLGKPSAFTNQVNATGFASEWPNSNVKVDRYVPAKPARICVWTRNTDPSLNPAYAWWIMGCENGLYSTLNMPGIYCHYCGGKIKRVRESKPAAKGGSE